ncbi:unnamed protein product [Meganyctiphanes norvegica]|uniref:Uncharacterized protein n=1 Tax=Meganyctiphanes norvegica TaxID=48144 RepID=A0AAV2QAB0_MEGNR
MNPLMLLPIMAMGCAAAPHGVVALHGAALPYAHLGHVSALPGYTVNGEIRTVDAADLKDLPLVAHTGVYAHHGLVHAPLAAYPAVVATEADEEEDKTVAVHAAVGYSGLGYHGLGLHGLGYNGLGLHGLGYNGLGLHGLGYNGLGLHGLGLHGLGYHGLPVVAAAAVEEESEE